MYIDLVANRGFKPAILPRESIRKGKLIEKRTIANLSALTLEQAKAIPALTLLFRNMRSQSLNVGGTASKHKSSTSLSG
jgi:hypothetical protein